jgi:hypothetical protein
MRKFCNIFIPRNIYTLFLILSEKNLKRSDNIILFNKNLKDISRELIFFLKKNKFRVIFDFNIDIFVSGKKKQNHIYKDLFNLINFIIIYLYQYCIKFMDIAKEDGISEIEKGYQSISR